MASHYSPVLKHKQPLTNGVPDDADPEESDGGAVHRRQKEYRTTSTGRVCVGVSVHDIVHPLSYFRGIGWSDASEGNYFETQHLPVHFIQNQCDVVTLAFVEKGAGYGRRRHSHIEC